VSTQCMLLRFKFRKASLPNYRRHIMGKIKVLQWSLSYVTFQRITEICSYKTWGSLDNFISYLCVKFSHSYTMLLELISYTSLEFVMGTEYIFFVSLFSKNKKLIKKNGLFPLRQTNGTRSTKRKGQRI
jgi:hypothetical protein